VFVRVGHIFVYILLGIYIYIIDVVVNALC